MNKHEVKRVIPELSNEHAFNLILALEHESTDHVDNVYITENGHYHLRPGLTYAKIMPVDPSTERGKRMLTNGKKSELVTQEGLYISKSKVIKQYSCAAILKFKDEVVIAYRQEVANRRAAEKAMRGEENLEEMTAKALEKLANGSTGNSEELDAKRQELQDKEDELAAKEAELNKKQAEIEQGETAAERIIDLKELEVEKDADGKFIIGKLIYGEEILTCPEKDFKKVLTAIKAEQKALKA